MTAPKISPFLRFDESKEGFLIFCITHPTLGFSKVEEGKVKLKRTSRWSIGRLRNGNWSVTQRGRFRNDRPVSRVLDQRILRGPFSRFYSSKNGRIGVRRRRERSERRKLWWKAARRRGDFDRLVDGTIRSPPVGRWSDDVADRKGHELALFRGGSRFSPAW